MRRACIRTGARIAGRLGARWYAVYVETPREAPGRITTADRTSPAAQHHARRKPRRHRRARAADRPADGLIAFAKREGITHVIFGQSARSRWEILIKGSTLNRFLEEVRRRRRPGGPARRPGDVTAGPGRLTTQGDYRARRTSLRGGGRGQPEAQNRGPKCHDQRCHDELRAEPSKKRHA